MQEVLDTAGPARALPNRPAGPRPLVVEVGCGHGEAALAFARLHPEVDVLATDVHTPGIVHLLEAAEAADQTNLYVERADALDVLDHRIGSAGLAAVHLFFPDPWPKQRHHKRRFIRPDVLDLLADRLVTGGAVSVATDVEDYAGWALEQFHRHPAFSGGVVERPAWRPVTRYEAAALDAGRRIVDLRHRRS